MVYGILYGIFYYKFGYFAKSNNRYLPSFEFLLCACVFLRKICKESRNRKPIRNQKNLKYFFEQIKKANILKRLCSLFLPSLLDDNL